MQSRSGFQTPNLVLPPQSPPHTCSVGSTISNTRSASPSPAKIPSALARKVATALVDAGILPGGVGGLLVRALSREERGPLPSSLKPLHSPPPSRGQCRHVAAVTRIL